MARNVDRILAIWQAIYPASYVESWESSGNYAVRPGTEVDAQSSERMTLVIGMFANSMFRLVSFSLQ